MLALALALAAARPLLVLPVTGVDVTTAELAELSAVDDAVRAAATARDDVTLVGKEQTLSALSQARAAGVACGVADVPCIKKLAVLSEAELVLVPVVAPRRDGTGALVVTLLEVAGPRAPERAGVSVPLKGKELDGEAKRLVDGVFEKWKEPSPDLDAIPSAATGVDDAAATGDVAPATTPAPAAATTADDGSGRLWLIGGTAAGALVVGAVAGGVIAWLIGTAPPRPPERGAGN